MYKNDPLRDSQSRQVNYGLEQSIGDFLRLTGQIGTGKRKANSAFSSEDNRLTWAGSVFLNLSQKFSFFYNVNKTVTSTSFNSIRSENTRRSLSMFLSLIARLSDNTEIDIIASRTRNTSDAVQDADTVFKNVTVRDLKLHRLYFLLLSEVWGYMPKLFKDRVPLNKFYRWLKMYQGKYQVDYEFKNGDKLVTVDSISFGRMNNQKCKDYIKEQIPIMYEILQMALPDIYANSAIETIEENLFQFQNGSIKSVP